MPEDEVYGEVTPKGVLFLRTRIGEVEGPDGTKYEIALTSPNPVPIIKSGKTGQSFVLDWEYIVVMAVEAGINEVLK